MYYSSICREAIQLPLKAKTLVKREYNLKAAGVRVGAGASHVSGSKLIA
jgi:hypothetical protein